MGVTFRRALSLIAGLCIAGSMAGCERENWGFVQSVGGMAVGTPQQIGQAWVLPIDADVSGLRHITTQATGLNSGLVCNEVRAEVENRNIYLSLVTAPAGLGLGHDAKCPPATLGQMKVGQYAVFYRGPRETPRVLGSIAIEPSAHVR